MDLSALRAAALSSKKRKRASESTDAAATAKETDVEVIELDGEDLEEGEISDHEGPVPSPPPTEADPIAIAQGMVEGLELNRHGLNGFPTPLPVPLPDHQPSFLSDRQEVQSIVASLLSYGVSPDYLIAYGISKELIARTFSDLGYPIPPYLSHLVSRPGRTVQAPLVPIQTPWGPMMAPVNGVQTQMARGQRRSPPRPQHSQQQQVMYQDDPQSSKRAPHPLPPRPAPSERLPPAPAPVSLLPSSSLQTPQPTPPPELPAVPNVSDTVTPLPRPELTLLEKQRRDELLARKAAIAERNAGAAKDFEAALQAELGDMLAGLGAGMGSDAELAVQEGEAGEEEGEEKEKEEGFEMELDPYVDDEVEDVAMVGDDTIRLAEPDQSSRSSLIRMGARTSGRRAVAADFDQNTLTLNGSSQPTATTTATVVRSRFAGMMMPQRPQKLIIDLSDEEEEESSSSEDEDEMEVEKQLGVGTSRLAATAKPFVPSSNTASTSSVTIARPIASRPSSGRNTPIPASLSAPLVSQPSTSKVHVQPSRSNSADQSKPSPAPTTSITAVKMTELQLKEMQIQEMKEMIARKAAKASVAKGKAKADAKKVKGKENEKAEEVEEAKKVVEKLEEEKMVLVQEVVEQVGRKAFGKTDEEMETAEVGSTLYDESAMREASLPPFVPTTALTTITTAGGHVPTEINLRSTDFPPPVPPAAPDTTFVPTYWSQYDSPFVIFPALRTQPLPPTAFFSPISASGGGGDEEEARMLRQALACFVVGRRLTDRKQAAGGAGGGSKKKRSRVESDAEEEEDDGKRDADDRLCQAESSGGVCHLTSCGSVHWRDFDATDDDKIDFLDQVSRQHQDATSSTEEGRMLYRRLIQLALDRPTS